MKRADEQQQKRTRRQWARFIRELEKGMGAAGSC